MGTTERSTNIATPWKAFALVLTIATIATTAIYLATRPTSAQSQSPPPSGAPSSPRLLTEAEVVAVVRDLQGLIYEAYEDRRPDSVSLAALPGSPYAVDIVGEIRSLIRNDLTIEVREEIRSVEAADVTEERVTARGVLLSDAIVRDAKGREVSKERSPELQEVEWLLTLTSAGWRIEEVSILSVEKIKR